MSRCELPDGRVLRYAQWGSPTGWPVIHLHGTPGCHLERYPDDALTGDLGIRFITFDRPGYGESSPHAGRRLADCASDVAALADELALGRFGLHAMSGGAPFLYAAAATLGDRITGAAVLAGLGPLDLDGAFVGMRPHNVDIFTTAAHAPGRLPDVLDADDEPLPKVDRSALVRTPGLLRALASMPAEIGRQGLTGVIDDTCAVGEAWAELLARIAVPVWMWHGDADTFVPAHHSRRVAARLADVRLTVEPGQGHLAMFGRQRAALSFLAGLARTGTDPTTPCDRHIGADNQLWEAP